MALIDSGTLFRFKVISSKGSVYYSLSNSADSAIRAACLYFLCPLSAIKSVEIVKIYD